MIATHVFFPGRTFIAIFFIFLGAFLCKSIVNRGTVYGDGRYYYAYVRSIVIDHDLNLENEYARFGINEPVTSQNYRKNVYAIGPAIAWFPLFTLIHTILRGDGFSWWYQIAIGINSLFFTLAGLLLLYRILCTFFSERTSTIVVTGIAFATNIFFYGSLDVVNSHSISFFVSSVLLTLVLQKQSTFLIGLCVGILSLIRSQDAIFLLLAFYSFQLTNISHIGNALKQIVKTIAGFIVGFLPQLIVWQILYGTFTRSPYLDTYHYFDFLHPRVIDVLFSPNNGLLYWTPLMVICLLGLCVYPFPKRIPQLLFFILFLVQLYLVASWSFWWQGASYSGRMFISFLPMAAFGLATMIEKLPIKLGTTVIVFFAVVNLSAIVVYLISH